MLSCQNHDKGLHRYIAIKLMYIIDSAIHKAMSVIHATLHTAMYIIHSILLCMP